MLDRVYNKEAMVDLESSVLGAKQNALGLRDNSPISFLGPVFSKLCSR